jgi:hypothetical protein
MSQHSRAVRIHSPGGAETMVLDTVTVGDPGPGEVRIRHHAVGLNFIDVYQRTGLYPLPMPLALGMAGAGVIEAVGDEDLTIIYINELSESAISSLLAVSRSGNLVVVEPFYQGTTAQLFHQEALAADIRIAFEGIPREFSHSYGSFSDQMTRAGFSTEAIRARILRHLQ